MDPFSFHAELKLCMCIRDPEAEAAARAGPLRRASVQQDHALALVLHSKLLSSELLPPITPSTILTSQFVLPQRATVATVVKLDRPFRQKSDTQTLNLDVRRQASRGTHSAGTLSLL